MYTVMFTILVTPCNNLGSLVNTTIFYITKQPCCCCCFFCFFFWGLILMTSMYPTFCLLSSQSHLLSLVCYLARSACHSFLLHATCFYGPVPWFPEQEHSGLVPVPGSSKVTSVSCLLKYFHPLNTLRWGVVSNDLACTLFLMTLVVASVPLATSRLYTKTNEH